jgi:hypothetical protein
MTFYLQDVADGKPLTSDYTLATLVVHLQKATQALLGDKSPRWMVPASAIPLLGLVLCGSGVGVAQARSANADQPSSRSPPKTGILAVIGSASSTIHLHSVAPEAERRNSRDTLHVCCSHPAAIMRSRSLMSLEEAILEAVRALPAEQQQEVLNHAARLRDEAIKKIPFKSVKGLWADLHISMSPDEIEKIQREMWRNFPRNDI